MVKARLTWVLYCVNSKDSNLFIFEVQALPQILCVFACVYLYFPKFKNNKIFV